MVLTWLLTRLLWNIVFVVFGRHQARVCLLQLFRNMHALERNLRQLQADNIRVVSK